VYDQEKVPFVAHQLFGTAVECWKHTTTIIRMLVISPGMSSKPDLELTMYLMLRLN
jgi:hypothetical protein